MRTKLTEEQKQLLDNLIENTILPALQEDVCIPDMSDKDVYTDKDFDDIYGDRLDVLYGEALTYLRNNLH